MRLIPALIASALLVSCGSDDAAVVDDNVATSAAAEDDSRLMCALKGAKRFEPNCTAEWTDSEQGRVLVLRGPDGGFRRLLLTGDARGFVAADGAEPAIIAPYDDRLIQVIIGEDRYRLPKELEQSGP